MKKLQSHKNGAIYKDRGKYLYITESGKTKRVYDSISELVEGENGQQTNEPQIKEAKAELVVETTQKAE